MSFEWTRTGSYWMDPDNTHKYGGHDLFNLYATIPVTGHFDLSGRVSNLGESPLCRDVVVQRAARGDVPAGHAAAVLPRRAVSLPVSGRSRMRHLWLFAVAGLAGCGAGQPKVTPVDVPGLPVQRSRRIRALGAAGVGGLGAQLGSRRRAISGRSSCRARPMAGVLGRRRCRWRAGHRRRPRCILTANRHRGSWPDRWAAGAHLAEPDRGARTAVAGRDAAIFAVGRWGPDVVAADHAQRRHDRRAEEPPVSRRGLVG